MELAAPRRSGATACIAIVCKEGLDGAETVTQQKSRQQVARYVVREHQQQNTDHDGCIAGVNQPRFAVPIDGTPQQNTRGYGGQCDEDKVDSASGQAAGGGVNRHIYLHYAIRQHEKEQRDGRRQGHRLERLQNA
uniref:hypothetical protein n=1 Tax=Alistipes putredinis TaxID=28117 RepID=UPI004027D42F